MSLRLFTIIFCPKHNTTIRYEVGKKYGKIFEDGAEKYGIVVKNDPINKCYRVKMTKRPQKNEKVFVCTQCLNPDKDPESCTLGEDSIIAEINEQYDVYRLY